MLDDSNLMYHRHERKKLPTRSASGRGKGYLTVYSFFPYRDLRTLVYLSTIYIRSVGNVNHVPIPIALMLAAVVPKYVLTSTKDASPPGGVAQCPTPGPFSVQPCRSSWAFPASGPPLAPGQTMTCYARLTQRRIPSLR